MKHHLNPNIVEGIQYLGLGLVGYFCFYVFMNVETDSVSVVYKRNDGAYGLLDTRY